MRGESPRARVTEVSEAGSVPFIQVANRADRPLLLLDGEELIGAKQNRILNTTVLVEAAALLRYDAGDRAAGACGQGGQPAQPVTTEPRMNVVANVRGRERVGLASALR